MMSKTARLRLVFCGTPQFAVPTLEALTAAGHEIALVVSQPDRPVGRDRHVAATPVKQAAQAAGLPVTQPEKIRNNPEFRAQLESTAPDVIINPTIVRTQGTVLESEGCLSLTTEQSRAEVARAKLVTVEAFDLAGRGLKISADEYLSRIFQHEIDHLDGVLFIFRMSPLKRNLTLRKIRKLQSEGAW